MSNLDQYGQPLRDPASAILQRKYAMAQALQKQGMDTSPVVGTGNNTMQALARVLQGGLGAYLGGQAEGEAEQMSAAQRAERQAAADQVAALVGGTMPTAPAAASAPAPVLTERLGGAPPVEAPAPVPQVRQAPLAPASGPTPPPGMYGRNAGAAVQRDAMLDAAPQVLADASSGRAAASGLPTGVAYRGATPASEGGDWDRGVAAPTGAVPAFGAGGAPRAVLANALAAPASAPAPAASPAADPDNMRQRAAALRALDARGTPGAGQAAAALEAHASRIEQRQYREQEVGDGRRIQAEDRALRERDRAADNDRAERFHRDSLTAAERSRTDGRLPPGYRMGPNGAERIPGLPPVDSNGPFSGTAIEAQNRNILARGEVGTQAYADAYADLAATRTNVDGSTSARNMDAYDPPTFIRPGARTAPAEGAAPAAAPDYTRARTTPPTQMNAEQGKIATFADRMAEALPIIERTAPASMSRTQQGLNAVPVVGNSLTSSDFQQASQAERNFINATLRRESGAVISPEEFVNARKQYIPQPGDDPEVLKQKADNRQTLHTGFIRDAGPAYRPPVPRETPQTDRAAPPRMGAVQDGYVFRGGDPGKPESWERVR